MGVTVGLGVGVGVGVGGEVGAGASAYWGRCSGRFGLSPNTYDMLYSSSPLGLSLIHI